MKVCSHNSEQTDRAGMLIFAITEGAEVCLSKLIMYHTGQTGTTMPFWCLWWRFSNFGPSDRQLILCLIIVYEGVVGWCDDTG